MSRPQLRSRAQRRFAPRLEALESRYAPACTWNSVTNVLTGTGNDTAEIRPDTTKMQVWCNGGLIGFTDPGETSMTFNNAAWPAISSLTLRNVDNYIGTYTVSKTSLFTSMHNFTANFNDNLDFMYLHPGIGNDGITLTNPTGPLEHLPFVYVEGGAGTDSVHLDATASSAGTYNIYEDLVFGGAFILEYYDVENLTFAAGGGNDDITIGNHQGTLDNLPATTVYGQGGVDKITFNDSGYSGGDTYTIGSSQMSLPNSLGVIATYLFVENLNLNTGVGHDSITVTQNQSQNFLFGGVVTVDSGGGLDTLTANDSSDAGGKTYHITDVNVCKESFGTPCVAFDSDLENLTLKTGAGSDIIDVTGSGNQLFDTPLVYLEPGAGANTLTVDDSGNPVAESYQVTEYDVSLPNTFGQAVVYPVGKIQTLTLKTGAANDAIWISNSAGTLALLPDIAIDGGGGNANLLSVSDAAYLGGDTYAITNNQVSMPNTLGMIATYSNIFGLTLYTGNGDDTVNAGNGDGTVVAMPDLGVYTYDGNDILNVDDHNNPNAATYDFDPNGTNYSLLSLPTDGFFVSGYLVDGVNLLTGAADDVVKVGSLYGTLDGLPSFRVDAGAGASSLIIDDHDYALGDTYTFHQDGLNLNQLTIARLGTILQFFNMPTVSLASGAGDDTFHVCQQAQGLLPANQNLALSAGDGTNTLNLYDQNNPSATTYVATSSGAGAGAMTVPSHGFDASFDSINVVNLHRSLKPGTVVDKSGYNPADYVLNVIPARPVGNNPADGNPVGPPSPVNPPPLPAPPIRDPLLASPVPRARSVARRATNAVNQSSAADLVFGDYLGDPLRSSVLTR